MYSYSPVGIQHSLLELVSDIKFRMKAAELDEVDILLLTALQEDADRTNVELARLAGLSPAATLHRVRRLKESGVIRVISARLDPAAAGFPLQVYVTATLARHDPRPSRRSSRRTTWRARPTTCSPSSPGTSPNSRRCWPA